MPSKDERRAAKKRRDEAAMDERIREHAHRMAHEAPPLTPGQIARVRRIISSGRVAGGQ